MSSNNTRLSLSVLPLRAHWHVYYKCLHESHVRSSWPRQRRHTSIVSDPYSFCIEYLRPTRITWLIFSRFSCRYHWQILGIANPWRISKYHGTRGFRLVVLGCRHNELVILELQVWPPGLQHYRLPWTWWLRLLMRLPDSFLLEVSAWR